MPRLFRPAARLFADRGGFLAKGVYRLAHAYISHYRNFNYDGRTNGEFALLTKCRAHDMRIVFDIGANEGDYTQSVLDRLSDATVHAFEVDPPVAGRFGARHQAMPVSSSIPLAFRTSEARRRFTPTTHCLVSPP